MVFIYYMLLSASVYIAEQHLLPSMLGIWIPNAAFAVVAVALLLRARRAEI